MKAARQRKTPTLPPAALGLCLLPFAVPMLVTLALVLTIGETWPRNIAPGSGLKLAGFVAATLTAVCVWWWATLRVSDAPVRKFVGLFCALTALMGWPVWSMGVLPSINGMALEPEQQTPMRLERLDITKPSRGGRGFYHWAWLAPARERSAIAQGRVFIPEEVYTKWMARHPQTVTLHHAKGLVGAEVLTRFDEEDQVSSR